MVLRSQLAELAKRGGSGEGEGRWEDLGGARAILPADTIPWGVAHFVGGAVLGRFPELCYDALLRPLADRTGIAVVCTPYELGNDHEALSQSLSAEFEAALAAGAVRYGWSPERMPRLLLGHSLGAKLQVLARCRPALQPGAPIIGVGLMAFNNFGVEDQVRLLRETLSSLQGAAGGIGAFAGAGTDRLWEELLQPAIGTFARRTGLEFRPGPEEMLEIVSSRFEAVGRTRAWRFGGDRLDCSTELLDALAERGAGADCSVMAGGHLTPVFVSLEDVAEKAVAGAPPGVAGRFADQFSGGFPGGGGALGNEAELEVLLEGLVSWIRKPA